MPTKSLPARASARRPSRPAAKGRQLRLGALVVRFPGEQLDVRGLSRHAATRAWGAPGRLTRHPRPAGFLRWVRGAGAPRALRGAPCGVPEFPKKGRGRRELGWLGKSYTFWAIYPSLAGIISKALWLAGPPVKAPRISAALRAGLVRELHGIRSVKHAYVGLDLAHVPAGKVLVEVGSIVEHA